MIQINEPILKKAWKSFYCIRLAEIKNKSQVNTVFEMSLQTRAAADTDISSMTDLLKFNTKEDDI